MRRVSWRVASALCVVAALLVLVEGQHYSRQHRTKRRCYECHMPMQCSSGHCYGDVCVKSLANGRYVSKGCENYTESYRSQSVSASVWDPRRDTAHCKTELVFGVESLICYCSDEDFCNSSSGKRYLLPAVGLLLLSLLSFRT